MSGRCTRRCFGLLIATCSIVIGALTTFRILINIQDNWSLGASLTGPIKSASAEIVFHLRRHRQPISSLDATAVLASSMSESTSGKMLLSPVIVPRSSRSCTNTGQGRVIVTDSNGFVCMRSDVLSGGCCPRISKAFNDVRVHPSPAPHMQPAQFSCATCSASSKCCTVYENCVSCCMAPEQRAALDALRSRTIHSGSHPSSMPDNKQRDLTTTFLNP